MGSLKKTDDKIVVETTLIDMWKDQVGKKTIFDVLLTNKGMIYLLTKAIEARLVKAGHKPMPYKTTEIGIDGKIVYTCSTKEIETGL